MRISTWPEALVTDTVGVLGALVETDVVCAYWSASVATCADAGPVELDFASIEIDVMVIEHPAAGVIVAL
jgi:hypothetical protein